MPLKVKNPFAKTKKKHHKVGHYKKPLLSSGERKRMTLYKQLLSEQKKAEDVRLGNSLKDSFEKYLATHKKPATAKKRNATTKLKRKKNRAAKNQAAKNNYKQPPL